MQTNHTPGPWICDPPKKSYDHINVWEKSGIGHVAAVSTGLLPDASAVSNAQLIAAAPELLEALQLLLGCVLMGGDPREGKGLAHPGTSPVAMARAAVTKACGSPGQND